MSGYKGIENYLPDHAEWIRRAARVINGLLVGRLNVTGLVTLAPDATATTLVDARIAFDSAILLVPTTASAAAALGTTWIPETGRTNGAVSIAHAASPATDRTFRYVVLG
ncbi:MAG TPA: hypothetical protein VF342_08915 [Alphaproteobacteria bacterium]